MASKICIQKMKSLALMVKNFEISLHYTLKLKIWFDVEHPHYGPVRFILWSIRENLFLLPQCSVLALLIGYNILSLRTMEKQQRHHKISILFQNGCLNKIFIAEFWKQVMNNSGIGLGKGMWQIDHGKKIQCHKILYHWHKCTVLQWNSHIFN